MADPRWLDDREQRAWRNLMVGTRLLADRIEHELQDHAGMPATYYELLVLLSEAPRHTLRMSELADLTLTKPSRITHAVNRLEQAGWVRREHHPADRRGWLAVLTDEGMTALTAAAPRHLESVRTHLVDLLTPAQLDHLAEIGEILVGHLTRGDR